MNKTVTVFTPTYNRGYIIMDLYQSLLRQTNFDFEWLVIDDGSTDDTEDLFKQIKEQNKKFPIVYIKKNNGGKHRAINDAVKIAKGRLFFIVDSDDQLTENAIDKILEWERTIQGVNKYAGISGNRGIDVNTVLGETFVGDWLDCTAIECDKMNILGDKAEVYYTDILRKYPFPEYENENFIGESIVWDKIGLDGYKIRYFNQVIYLCQYREDGLTRNLDEINKKNPRGCAANLLQAIAIRNYCRRDVINAYYTYYENVAKEYGVKKCAEFLNISKYYMYYIIFRCSCRDRIRSYISRKNGFH